MTTTDATCCGRPSRRVDFNAPGSTVTLVHCPVCEGSRWLRDGQPVNRADAFAVFATVPRRASRAA